MVEQLAIQRYGKAIRVSESGEFFGERCFQAEKLESGNQGNGRSATAVILEDTELLVIEEREFNQYFKEKKIAFDKKREEMLL